MMAVISETIHPVINECIYIISRLLLQNIYETPAEVWVIGHIVFEQNIKNRQSATFK